MNDGEFVIEEIDDLQKRVAALGGAFVVLARHLAVRGFVDLDFLPTELETLAQSQPDPVWQQENQRLADVLRVMQSRAAQRK